MNIYAAFHFESLVWNWAIAVYLFLVGVSAGMVIIAFCVRKYCLNRNNIQPKDSATFKAMAIVSPITVISGLLILIFHLSRPFDFWKIMVFYNLSSPMSLGVILFQVYMIALFLWLAVLFETVLLTTMRRLLGEKLSFITNLTAWIIAKAKPFEKKLALFSLIFALSLGAYTGFLLSALKSYPLLNNPVLPVLFMFSGISSGAAACILCAVTWFKESTHSAEIALIHHIELPVVLMEVFLLFTFFMGAYFGGGQKTIAVINAIGSGFWAQVFWIGVIGVGIIFPLVLNMITPSRLQRAKTYLILTTTMSLAGIFMLRHFILYAGQMTLV